MSRNGAKLVLRAGDALPLRFRLHLLTRDAAYNARRMWRRGELAGVRFEEEENGAQKSSGEFSCEGNDHHVAGRFGEGDDE